MLFPSTNWTVVAIMTLVNILLGYLYFDSRLTAKWRASFETKAWKQRSRSELYLYLVSYSFLLSWFAWFFADNLTVVRLLSLILPLFVYFSIELLSPSSLPKKAKADLERFRLFYMVVSLGLSIFLISEYTQYVGYAWFVR